MTKIGTSILFDLPADGRILAAMTESQNRNSVDVWSGDHASQLSTSMAATMRMIRRAAVYSV